MVSLAGVRHSQIQGLKEAQALLKDFSGEPIKNPVAVLIALGDQIVADMQDLAPVDTGFMQSEIGVTDVAADSVAIESPASYSGFVEYGTIHQEPQPFFEPPIENLEADVIIDDIINNYNDLVAKYNPFRGEFHSIGRSVTGI